ncbi:hypothetical protein emb_1c0082 [Coriobacteriaceae bacterium EMTCatB1]|nr:hypothetical protein emb_1c0082 [Coriobacteriaceae bacterium EMTCatB1]
MDRALTIVLLAALAAIVLAGVVVGALLLWRRTVKRYLITLIGRREGVRAGLDSFAAVVKRLADASDGDLIAFALDDGHEDRKALREVASRMRVDAIELATMPLPKELIPLADDLSDAAELVAEQAEAISEATGPATLDQLAAVDLPGIRRYLDSADAAIAHLKGKYRLEDDVVYGGGLYI